MLSGLTAILLTFTMGCQPTSSVTSEERGGGEITTMEGPAALSKSWDKTPIPFYMSSTVPEELVQAILDSFSLWEVAAGKTLFEYQGRIHSEAHDFDGVNVVYWDNEEDPDGNLGVTHAMWSSKHRMMEADIVFHGDPSSFEALGCGKFKGTCKIRKGKYDITTTALHEIGHFMGFEHTSTAGAIMNPNFGMNDVKQDFDTDLVTSLKETYNPSVVASR